MILRTAFTCLVLLASQCTALFAQERLRNQLTGNASPYLALHADDPVHWQQWNRQTLERARQEDKLLYVSVGYYACYWCHVMRRESYQNAKIAAFINEHYIPVKVDRELEPVLDERLMRFVNETRGYGGWPLNVFITGQGNPLIGIVYLPPDQFFSFIESLNTSWASERDHLKTMAADASASMARNQSFRQHVMAHADVARMRLGQKVMDQAMGLSDDLMGGFGNQTKFPMVAQLSALLELSLASNNTRVRDFVVLTLEHMAAQGLRDHIGGGFFRYTVDPDWHTPHFEKMLYDNALLSALYLRAGQQLNRPDFTRIGLETLAFMRREMSAPDGAYIASLSAVDDKDVEGGYYLWSLPALRAALSATDWAALALVWNLDSTEDEILPRIAMSEAEAAKRLGLSEQEIAVRVNRARQALLTLREKRGLPRDDKRLAAWNALALTAFSAGAALGDAQSKQAAQDLQAFIRTSLWQDTGLQRAVDAKAAGLGPANLQDYAYTAQALLDYAELSGAKTDYALAEAVSAKAWHLFRVEDGWLSAEQGLLPNEAPSVHISDSVLPSASAVLLSVSRRMLKHNAHPKWKAAYAKASQEVIAAMLQSPFDYATQVALFERDAAAAAKP